jgi:DNA-directed RNA polymerase specialized sigma24 family protein
MQDSDELVDAWRDLSARASRAARGGRGPGAEDHVQDAIVAALEERRRTGRTPDAPRSWLGTVARRREVDTVRRAVRERRAAAASCGVGATDADVALEVLDRHEAHWLAAHVEQLPARTRDVVRELGSGASQADVALALGLTPRAVEGHVRRARLALRRVLERAGSVAALLRGGRLRLRRRVPVIAVGAAAAVVAAGYLFPDSVDRLVPLPPPKPVHHPLPPGAVAALPLPAGPVGPSAVAAVPPPPVALRAPRRTADPPDTPPTAPPATSPPAANPGADALVASSKGGEVTSRFATDAAAWYDITVSGSFSYNGKTGLADCGHYIPEGSLTWNPLDALFVDGERSPCPGIRYSPLHTYTWRQRGTGDVLRFRVNDWGGTSDNVGALTISITRVVAEG